MESAAPGRSMRGALGSRLVGTRNHPATMARTITGTLMRKTECHE